MAIPIGLPNSEDAEDCYRSLDLLLEQLLITLRQVLIHRRRVAAANAPLHTVRHRHIPNEGTPTPVEEQTSEQIEEATTRVSPETISNTSLPLPDVVLDASPDCVAVSEEQKEADRIRNVVMTERTEQTTTPPTTTTTTTTTATTTAQTHGWVQVGADLKRLADQLLATNRLDQKDEKKSKMKDDKDASLLSLLCPPLGGSVWTTVALLVGWGLLSRTR